MRFGMEAALLSTFRRSGSWSDWFLPAFAFRNWKANFKVFPCREDLHDQQESIQFASVNDQTLDAANDAWARFDLLDLGCALV